MTGGLAFGNLPAGDWPTVCVGRRWTGRGEQCPHLPKYEYRDALSRAQNRLDHSCGVCRHLISMELDTRRPNMRHYLPSDQNSLFIPNGCSQQTLPHQRANVFGHCGHV